MSIIYSQNVTLDNIFVNNTVTTGGTAGTRGVISRRWLKRAVIANVYFKANTDGANTIRSSHIAFNNWTVYNGDDSISLKGNSTDISVTNSHFYNGLGIAIGSIGQYEGEYEVIQDVTVENITYDKTQHAVGTISPESRRASFDPCCDVLMTFKFYFKTWTGTQVNYPPNGGGGGIAGE